ncbi:alcohol dehydrogenase catalytic domain-containing protein [Antrihabitans sp. YC2-6]|uniref:alcohol dehydrogenase catalytic domain-containing protein n=1 Tax=Antrihabitans sp. YC2-6 TaxID=2799498 RepID=UPI0018F4FACB|nr:alcohol dehydrogenase catalytic domain-containing protein [Antrihabitans sp. YC2-6]MBJ8348937.1 alcohol dehydrogenase catalytic domain-containing protein [Antrihabitans sp. YC2-6]
MRIRGAVLEDIGRPRPYRDSRPLTISELELAPPGPGEVLVRIEAAGLCHSDLSVVDGNRVRPVPMLLGHEASGRIEVLGDGVTDLAVGDRVVMTFLPRCGDCAGCATEGKRPCIPGSAANVVGGLLGGGSRLTRTGEQIMHHLGVSAFATHAVVDTHSIVRVPDDIPPDVAAVLGCAVLTGGGAIVNAAPPSAGDTVIVVGLGGVGMAAILTALAYDGVRVIGVDAVASKLDAAIKLGAHAAYRPDDIVQAAIKAPLVIDATGSARALEGAIALTEPGGTTVTVGLPAPDARTSFSPTSLVAEGRTIVGSYLGSAVPSRDIPTFAEMWRAGRLPVDKLVSSRIALEDINDAMDELADGRAIRQIIDFEAAE